MEEKPKKVDEPTRVVVEDEEAPILLQMFIFAAVLFVSSLISNCFPKSFPVPTPVIGLILLYLLLTTGIVKLRHVEKFGDFMIGLIGFLFVPSGIKLAGSLELLQHNGIQIICVIIISTIIMLVIVTYTAFIIIKISKKLRKQK